MINNISVYETNKNIFIEGIENSIPVKIVNFLTRILISYFASDPKVVLSERTIEYPILFQNLKPAPRKILDFGCVEDLLPIHLANLGYKVTGVDFREYPFAHKNFTFVKKDILSWTPPIEEYDSVVSISTIEHVGLSAYGDPEKADGDKIAVEKLWNCLRTGGDLIISLPAGKPRKNRIYRVYDQTAIEKLIPDIETLKFFYKPNRYGEWQETTGDVISELIYDDYEKTNPAQGVAFVVSKK